jgi:hypothetical protein
VYINEEQTKGSGKNIVSFKCYIHYGKGSKNQICLLITSIYLSIHPPIRPSICPSVCLSIYLPTHLPTYLPTYQSIYLFICLSAYLSIYLSSMALQPLWTLAAFQFLDLYTVGRAPCTGDQPVTRPLPTHRTTQTQKKRIYTSMPRVGFEPMIPVFERAKTVRALDRVTIVIGSSTNLVLISEYNFHAWRFRLCSIYSASRINTVAMIVSVERPV